MLLTSFFKLWRRSRYQLCQKGPLVNVTQSSDLDSCELGVVQRGWCTFARVCITRLLGLPPDIQVNSFIRLEKLKLVCQAIISYFQSSHKPWIVKTWGQKRASWRNRFDPLKHGVLISNCNFPFSLLMKKSVSCNILKCFWIGLALMLCQYSNSAEAKSGKMRSWSTVCT